MSLRFAFLLVMAFASFHPLIPSLIAQDKPNVLFIAIDDMNDWIGCLGGHPQTLTPNIDALAARGILFTNAHCASPACNPSRAAIFSGRQAEVTGVWSNDSAPLLKQHPDILVIPRAFQRAGYTTLGTGKMMHGSGKDNVKIFEDSFNPEQRWSPFTAKEVHYTDDELPSKGTENPRHVVARNNGDSIVLPLNRMPSDRNPSETDGESFDWGPVAIADNEMGDTQITDWAMDRLRETSQPMFLGVGYYRPHIPLFAPTKYFEPFPLANIQLPTYTEDDLNDLNPTGKRWALDAITAGSHQTVLAHDQWASAVQAYLACAHYVDHEVGRLLLTLDGSQISDTTWVVLWTDHGWHLGEKQHWGKWTGWERSTRVPLIVVPPKKWASDFAKPGSRCDQPVSLIDLYPTLVEACGVAGPDQLDGQSLLPLLRDPAMESGRTVKTAFDQGNVSLRNSRWRYIRYADATEELYDHSTDPNEWHNLANDPKLATVLKEFRKVAD